MKKVKILTLLISFVMLFASTGALAAPQATAEPKTEATAEPEVQATAEPEANAFPEPRAKAALLYDLKGGRIIYQSHADERVYPASVTKIMTALLALEKGNLSDTLTVTDTALADINYLHSRIDLKAGEQMTLENLLTALLVCSANDAANVIAEYISGDIQSFVELMNQRAAELGMSNTHFANPHGFHDDNHYTTASDIAALTVEALKNITFCNLVKTKTYTIPATNISKERMISSTNHLISRYRNTYHYYPYATGVKTGSTTEAGSCLVAAAEKNGVSLLSVVMGCDNKDQKENAYSFTDTKAMFEYIFANCKSVTIASTNEVVSDSKVYEAKNNTRVALSPSKDVIMLLPSDYKAEEISFEPKLAEEIKAPIEKGGLLGSATYSFRGETIATVDLVAANEVKRDNFLHFLHIIGRVIFSPYVIIPLIIIAAFLILNTYRQSKQRRMRRRYMKSRRPQQRSTYQSRSGYSRPRGGYPTGYRGGTQQRSSARRTGTRYQQNGSRPSSRTRRPQNRQTPADPWDKYR